MKPKPIPQLSPDKPLTHAEAQRRFRGDKVAITFLVTKEEKALIDELFEEQGAYGVKQVFYRESIILGAKFLKNQN